MKKSICFYSTNTHVGKVARDFPNMRTEFAWQCALDAFHIPLSAILESGNKFDLGIIILPKDLSLLDLKRFATISKNCQEVAVMQEGPNDYWHNYDVYDQQIFLGYLAAADFILCHNIEDKAYYSGLLGNDEYNDTYKIYNLQSLIIEDSIPKKYQLQHYSDKENIAVIGGNFCGWYNGRDSYEIARSNPKYKIIAPSMGRKREGEETLEKLEHWPYLNFASWMANLSQAKIGVHMMRTFAAGTFALNCAYYGIPCIGYEYLDTQHFLHPVTSVENMQQARFSYRNLTENEFFYNERAHEARTSYLDQYTEEKWLKTEEVQRILK